MADRARTLTEEAPSIDVPWLLALRVRILFHGKSCGMAIINDPIPVANIRSYIVDLETGGLKLQASIARHQLPAIW